MVVDEAEVIGVELVDLMEQGPFLVVGVRHDVDSAYPCWRVETTAMAVVAIPSGEGVSLLARGNWS